MRSRASECRGGTSRRRSSGDGRAAPGGPARWVGIAGVVLVVLAAGGCEYLGLSASPSGDGRPASGGEEEQASGDESGGAENGGPEGEGDEKTAAELAGEDDGPARRGGSSDDEEGRNPFEPQVDFDPEPSAEDEKADEPEEIEHPLARYSLDQLRLAGILSGMPDPKALFIDPEGMGHLLREGESLGEEGRELKDVRPDEVVVRMPAEEPGRDASEEIMQLVETDLPAERSTGGLTDEQREILRRLRRSEEGRRALKESYEDLSGRRGSRQGEGGRPGGSESGGPGREFPGSAPPDRGE